MGDSEKRPTARVEICCRARLSPPRHGRYRFIYQVRPRCQVPISTSIQRKLGRAWGPPRRSALGALPAGDRENPGEIVLRSVRSFIYSAVDAMVSMRSSDPIKKGPSVRP